MKMRSDQQTLSKFAPGQRDGSTLLIVLVLLGLLALIGLLFYTFAADAQSSAKYFSESQKVYVADIDPEVFFDWGLQQLIVGPDATLTQSALAGKRHSLLPNLFGRDIHPYNSAGVRLASVNGRPIVDADQDGVADTTGLAQQPLEFNDSAVVNSTGGYASARDLTGWPDPGVDYTYPDINNLFLAYKGYAIAPDGTTVQVIIPSFHRPQLLRTAGGAPSASWWNDPLFTGRMLRPHPDQRNPDGNTRFPTATGGTTLTTVFPFGPDALNPNRGQQGVWTSGYSFGAALPAYEWDADNDGDLVKEGIWMDLNFPVQTTSSGQKYVPLMSYTVYDADALFNLNVHGNVMALAQSATTVGNVAAVTRFLSMSSQGLTPAEVNPQLGLNSDPNLGPDFSGTLAELDAATKQHQYQYGVTPGNALQMSNLEWYRLLSGSANFQSATAFNDLYPGRNGEVSVLFSGLQYGVTNGGSIAATPLNRMPFPGVSGSDDNWNKYEGMLAWEAASGMPGISQPSTFVLQYTLNTPQFYPANFAWYAAYPAGQPLDYRGDGTIAQTGSLGKNRLSVTSNRMKFPQYYGYDNPGGTSNYVAAGTSDETIRDSVAAAWHPGSLQGQQMLDQSGSPLFTGAGQGPLPAVQIDEDVELTADPINASSSDTIFPTSEAAGLHLSATDRSNRSVSSRPRVLAPFNLGSSVRSDSLAQQYTPLSWDRKQFGISHDGIRRLWEFTDLYDTNGNPSPDGVRDTFPPQFGSIAPYAGNDPLRAPVRKLLEMRAGNTNDFSKKQFRLSLNHLTTTDSSGNVVQRALTPHDPTLSRNPVVYNSQSQEDFARRDRQQMARDIYVMLYLLGGGIDLPAQSGFTAPVGAAGYTGDNSGFNLYNDRQLREMAQFAVNVVDALDPDHILTKFEYDKNLGDGWNLDDNPYSRDTGGAQFTAYTASNSKYNADFPEDSNERGVVYGVEPQELTLSEVLAFQCPKLEMPAGTPFNHTATEHDDGKVRYFTYLELRNISLKTVDLTGQQWRLRSVPVDKLGTPGKERWVTFRGGTITSGSLLTLGNAGETDSALPSAPLHSRFRCDNTQFGMAAFDATDPRAFIAPKTAALDLDLVADRDQTGTYKFQLVDPGTTLSNVTDDNDITNTASGTDGAGRFFNDNTIVDPTRPQDERPTFILERRQYPDRPAPSFQSQTEEDDNPWVPVDRVTLDNGLTQFGLQTTDSMRSNYDTRLQNLKSTERNEPLVRPTATNPTLGVTYNPGTSTSGIVSNSLMAENSASPLTFTHWQLSFDRPFASPVELFHIPLYGPQYITKWTATAADATETQLTDLDAETTSLGGGSPPPANLAGLQNAVPYAATAAGKILHPEETTNQAAAPGAKSPSLDNRWYRLFEFYEVPTRTHRQLGNPFNIVRIPGKINLNMVRHASVLGGLLDDTDVMTFAGYQTLRPTLSSNDGTDGDGSMPAGRRDWWVQFLQARDGRRVFNAGDADATGNLIARNLPDNVTGLYLPGLADSRPFRSFSTVGSLRIAGSVESASHGLDETLFRRLPFDLSTQPSGAALTAKRQLLEVGNATEHSGGSVDQVMRHRLLSKMYNNTTNRSHVFLVFMSVQLFEADDSAGSANVRIGGPLQNSPTYREFFVIDRSQPEEAYDSGSNTFRNFRALVKHRLPLN